MKSTAFRAFWSVMVTSVGNGERRSEGMKIT